MFVMKAVWARKLGRKMHDEGTLNEAQYARREQVAEKKCAEQKVEL